MAKKSKRRKPRRGFAWWVKNLLAAVLAYLLLPDLVSENAGYKWLVDNYAKGNLKFIKQYSDIDNSQRYEMKLGNDYAFVNMIRRMTPEDAVIFYPSRKDFTDAPPGSPVTFSGNLCGKLSAVRFLYPRRIVTEDERGKTPWGKQITHVAVVNGHGVELLPYNPGPGAGICVLPVDSAQLISYMQR